MNSKAFQILVSLAAEPMHGYAIRQQVEERTDGEVRLWPATLYGTLSELTADGLIEETDGPDGDPRRKYYALSARGRVVLREEAARLETLARTARTHLSLGEARS